MRKRCVLLMGLLSVFMVGTSYALQSVSLHNNETASVFFAQKGKTRLVVEGSRIANLHGTMGAYVFKNDNNLGQVYLTPTAAFAKKPFSLFITTESGKTFGLILTPKNSLSETIVIAPKKLKKSARRWERESTYTRTMVRLIRHLVAQTVPDGYNVVSFPKKPISLKSPLRHMKVSLVYGLQGDQFSGQILRLTNTKHHAIAIHESTFYSRNVVAMAFTAKRIPAHQFVYLYLVKQNV